MLLRPKKCYSFKNIYLFLYLRVIFGTLGSFWLKNSSNFGKVQFCPELSNFSRFYLVLATGEDFSTNVRLLYKPCDRPILHKPAYENINAKAYDIKVWLHFYTMCVDFNFRRIKDNFESLCKRR